MSLHQRTRAYGTMVHDENSHQYGAGVHKSLAAAPIAADAKRSKTSSNSLPAARPLTEITNANRAPVQDAAKKPAATSSNFLPQIRAAEPMQQYVPQTVATNDAMETDLDDGIQSLSIAPAAQVYAAAPAAYIAPITPAVQPIEVDEKDKMNAQMCSEYGQDIQAYWRQAEVRRAPSATYMSRQTDVNPKMREILVDWMVEVQLKFKLKDETLFLSIHLLDRFLERRLTNRTKLQLVGCTALLLAAKYEEIFAPEINDFVAISDNAYTREQILAMEGIMLNSLGFNLTVPLPLNFLQRFARLGGVEQGDQAWQLSMYFMELTLQSYLFLGFKASEIAASALYLSLSTAKQLSNVWSPLQQQQIGYTPDQISNCVHEMYKLIALNESGQAKYKAVKKKYSLEKFGGVAKYICRPPTC